MNIFKKIRWIAGISMVFLLILATNLIDQDNFEKVEASVETIYQDRLLTKDLIFDLKDLMHTKEIAYLTNDTAFFDLKNEEISNKVYEKLDQCESAMDSKKEENIISSLNSNFEDLTRIEENSSELFQLPQSEVIKRYELIEFNISELREVQLEEGKRQKIVSQDALESAKLYARIEIYMLIVLALLVQFLVIYNPKKKKKGEEA